jgi:hypothetical protein
MNGSTEPSLYERIRPPDFFEVRVHEPSDSPGVVGLLGLCANYEQGRWRSHEFAELLFDYLPEFALDYSELEQFNPGTGRRQLRKAARLLYDSDKYRSRGEFGELLLHAICREIYRSEPAISKVFFKGALNETVHGFDAVHAVSSDGVLDLLLGEVKFYSDVSSAMTAVAAELQAHLAADWLRDECMLILNRLDDRWPHSDALRQLVAEQQTLDRIFSAIRVPVVLTYDSKCIAGHISEAPPYPETFEAELRDLHVRFKERKLPLHVVVDLIPVPLRDKADLVKALHNKLETVQEI